MQYALCPSCLSTLQVTVEQLTMKDGVIRCGHCQSVFNANENEVTPSDQPLVDDISTQAIDLAEFVDGEQAIHNEPPTPTPSWEAAKQREGKQRPYGLL
jgi:predicted Zn finger-like uncharacterized protein